MSAAVADALGVNVTFGGTAIPAYLVPGRAASISLAGHTVGTVGMLAPSIVSAAGLASTDELYVGELDLDALTSAQSITPLTVTPLPRSPSIARDISIVVDETLPAETVRGTIRAAAPGTRGSIREFDRYQGKGVPDGRVSLSLRLTFRSLERTLTDAEVEAAMTRILSALKDAHDAIQR